MKIMNNSSDDFGPWLESQPIVGFCPFCKEEKSESEIGMPIPDDMMDMTKKVCDFNGDVKLPLILCKICKSRLERKMRAVNESLEKYISI